MFCVVREIPIDTFFDLQKICWGGALQTLEEVEKLDLEEEFLQYVIGCLSNEDIVSETTLNDFIWFDCDNWIEEHREEE